MENLPPSDAALQLADAARVRAAIEVRADYRGYAIRRIWSGAVLACYFGAIALVSLSPQQRVGGAVMGLLGVLFLWQAFEEGARGRAEVGAPVRTRRRTPSYGAAALSIGTVLVLSILTLNAVFGLGMLLWAIPLVVLAVFVCALIPGLRILRDAPASVWPARRERLPVSIRIGTVVTAVALATAARTAGFEELAGLVPLLAIAVPLVLSGVVQRERWGAQAIGAVWAPAQWIGFAASSLLTAAVIVLAAWAPAVQQTWALPLAVLTALPLAATALLPGLDTDV